MALRKGNKFPDLFLKLSSKRAQQTTKLYATKPAQVGGAEAYAGNVSSMLSPEGEIPIFVYLAAGVNNVLCPGAHVRNSSPIPVLRLVPGLRKWVVPYHRSWGCQQLVFPLSQNERLR